jgi:hypothetical protein
MNTLYAFLIFGTIYALLILGIPALDRRFTAERGKAPQPKLEPQPSREGEEPSFFIRVLAFLAALKCFLMTLKATGWLVIWIADAK